MATVIRSRPPRTLVRPAPGPRWFRLRGITLATAAGGAALALLVGRDGTPGWRLARVLGVSALTAAVAGETRAGDRGRGRIATAAGIPALAVGAGFTPFLVKDPVSPEALAGTVLLAAGPGLAVAGVAIGTRGRRRIRRIGAGALTVVAAVLAAFVAGVPVAATNVPRPAIGATPESRGLVYESVAMRTGDGVSLAGWYVRSTNRAAVVLLHGAGSTRSDVLDQATVLARHGYGVLMVDARGHGESGGRAMDFGWFGDADIAAATAFLAQRPDVDRQRIGAVGLSMGGEEAVGATAANGLLRGVVAEGATARNAGDESWLSDEFGTRGLIQEQLERLQDLFTDALTSASVPTSMRAAVERSAARYLLIAGGDEPDEARSGAHVAAGAPTRVETWTVPGSGHTGGLRAAPAEWEQRVIAFLGAALDVPPAAG